MGKKHVAEKKKILSEGERKNFKVESRFLVLGNRAGHYARECRRGFGEYSGQSYGGEGHRGEEQHFFTLWLDIGHIFFLWGYDGFFSSYREKQF